MNLQRRLAPEAIRATSAPTAAQMITGELIERFAAFTIIVLGETLTGVVAGLSGQLVSRLIPGVGLVAAGFMLAPGTAQGRRRARPG